MPHEVMNWAVAAERLKRGEIGVIPTDTLYGIVGSALKPSVVESIYDLRQRELDKPMIVLIGGWGDIAKFQIEIDDRTHFVLNKVWPGPVSVVVAAGGAHLEYLHRGTRGIALRMPAKPQLRELLAITGPLVAPSANLAGEMPAETVAEARDYFGDKVFYLDDGPLDNPPSALVDARTDPPRILRPVPGFRLQ